MGVDIMTIRPGDGKSYPRKGQTVSVHYVGWSDEKMPLVGEVSGKSHTTKGTLTNGKKFDSSRDRGEPFKFSIGRGEVIRAWDEGVAQMSIGQMARLTCSPDYAYGAAGYPPVIPGNSTLIFEVELLGFS